MKEKSTVLQSLKPFLVLAKLIGIFGCNVSGDRVKKSSVAETIYTASWIFVTCYYIGYVDERTTNLYEMLKRRIEQRSAKSLEKFYLLGGATLIAIFQQRKTIRYFDRIDDYDRRVRSLGFSRRDKTMLYWIMSLIPGTITVGRLFWRMFNGNAPPSSVAFMFLMHYYDVMQYFIVMTFCMYVDQIYQRFRFLNERVTRKIQRGSVMHMRRSVTIYDVRYLHTKLCEAGKALAEVYSFWVVVWCIQAARSTLNVTLSIARTGNVPNYLAFTAVWLISLCWTCGITSNEANLMARILLKVRPLSGDAADTMDRAEMAMYLCNHELIFTAGNIFTINHQFILQLAGFIVTYVTYK